MRFPESRVRGIPDPLAMRTTIRALKSWSGFSEPTVEYGTPSDEIRVSWVRPKDRADRDSTINQEASV